MPLQSFPAVRGSGRWTSPHRSNVAITGTAVVANATVGLYGASWTQLVASTSFDANWIRIQNTNAINVSATRADVLLQIAFGGSGSEYVVINALVLGSRAAQSSVMLPLFIPAGTRISAKTAAGIASKSVSFAVDYGQAFGVDDSQVPRAWVGYGLTTGSGVGAYGTPVTPGSSNAWGSWTAITTSTTYAHELWFPSVGNGSSTGTSAVQYRTQIAHASTTDAATMATNATVFDGPWWSYTTAEIFCHHGASGSPHVQGFQDLIYAPRAAGSPISARAMCSGTPGTTDTTIAMLGAIF